MLRKARLEEILSLIRSSGSLEVSQLCRIFNVTEMTVRRDLDDLAEKGLIIRTHGGGVLPEENILVEQPYEIRLQHNPAQKTAIAREAVKILNDSQKVFIDSGTTMHFFASAIGNHRNLVVVTNGINIASELNIRTSITVISVGGELRKNSLSCVGYFAENMINNLRVDLAFLSVSGIGAQGELFSASMIEVGPKRAVLNSAKKTIVLADSSKIGVDEFVSIGSIKDIDYLVTDSGASKDILNRYREMGVQVLVAESRN